PTECATQSQHAPNSGYSASVAAGHIGQKSTRGDRGRVLVVDDDAAIRELLETILVADGYRVFAEADGDAALARVKREQPDLVLLDVMLGAQDGLDLLAQLRRTSDVPVIFLTARGHETDR